jgi:single-stranded-DNA-specific exonuclease
VISGELRIAKRTNSLPEILEVCMMRRTAMQIIAHEDADGVCSAALVKMTNPSSRVFFSKPCGLLHDLDQMDTRRDIVLLDLALCELAKEQIVSRLSRWSGRVLYIDHHPDTATSFPRRPNLEIVAGDVSASELTFAHQGSGLRREAERVMLMGAIGDYADLTPLCLDRLNRWDKRSVFLQAGFLCGALEVTRTDHEFHREIVDLLASCRPPCEDSRIVAHAVRASELEESFRQRVEKNAQKIGKMGVAYDLNGPAGKGATYAAAAMAVSVGAYVDRDTRRGFADISFRVIDRSLDMNRILRAVTPKLGASGGGHPEACGARVPLDRLNKFLQAINDRLVSAAA